MTNKGRKTKGYEGDRLTTEMYNFLVTTCAERETMPNLKELMSRFDFASSSSVRYHLDKLERWGWIRREGIINRAIHLTRMTEVGLSPKQLKALIDKGTDYQS